MSAPEPPLPQVGSAISTACKGTTTYQPDTPTTVYRGQRIYFCTQECLQAFLRDAKTSCLAGDPLLEEDN